MDNIKVSSSKSLNNQRFKSLLRWFDTQTNDDYISPKEYKIDWFRAIPFILIHLACFAVIWVGVSPIAVITALFLYCIRMFSLTGFYHRYFSHKTFKTSRTIQFIFAVIGASCVQRGPLWWAAHHRNHHKNTDTELDLHSPKIYGFLWSHMGWFLTPHAFKTDFKTIPDIAKFPELKLLDRFDIVVPVLLAIMLFFFGVILHHVAPQLGTTGFQMLVWGFFISTVILFHATVTINSLAHQFGTRRYETKETSHNNALLALITFGEGWHNNHHFFPGTVRQGFYWWEIDITYYGLRLMQFFGLVHGLKPVPAWVYTQNTK